MVAQKVVTDINQSEGKPIRQGRGTVLPQFYYKNGYTLCLADLGKAGVKVELIDSNEGSAAVILPPDKTQEASRWLSKTIGRRSPSDRAAGLPEELSKILGRLLKNREPKKILERGDKKTIKEALKLLATRS